VRDHQTTFAERYTLATLRTRVPALRVAESPASWTVPATRSQDRSHATAPDAITYIERSMRRTRRIAGAGA
jgi:hypothetical protein